MMMMMMIPYIKENNKWNNIYYLLVISKKTKYDRQITKVPTNGAGNNFCIKTALQEVGSMWLRKGTSGGHL
jgi:hypothetical protein